MAMIVATSFLYRSLKDLELEEQREMQQKGEFKPQYPEQGEKFTNFIGTATTGQ